MPTTTPTKKTPAKKTPAKTSSSTPKARYFGALRAVAGKLDPLASRMPLAGRLPKPGQVTERYIGLVERGFAVQGRLPGARRLKAVGTD